METKYEMSINGVGNSAGFGNGGVSVTALDDMDYNYISSVTHNNDHLQNYQKTLDFCMLWSMILKIAKLLSNQNNIYDIKKQN